MTEVLSFKKAMAKGLLTPKEIERFAVAAMCSSDTFKVDWDACAIEGSTTKASFQVMYNSTLRKLKQKKCFRGTDEEEDDQCGARSNASTPGANKGGRKRKDAGYGEDATPGSGRKQGAKKQKTKPAMVEDKEDDILDYGIVKAENAEDDDVIVV